jgi:hypothetical protein
MGKYQEVRMTKGHDKELAFTYSKDVNYITRGEEQQFLQMIHPNKSEQADNTYPCILYLSEDSQDTKDIYCKIPSLAKFAQRGYVVAMKKSKISTANLSMESECEEVIEFLHQNASDFQFDKEHLFVLWDLTENDELNEAREINELVTDQHKALKHITAVISLGGKEKLKKFSNLTSLDFPPVLQVSADESEGNNGWWSEHNFDMIEDFMSNYI